MKIVIDIPEEIYKASKIIDVQYEDVVQIPLEVIANGTPLPKGHGRLIDADAYAKKYNTNINGRIGDEYIIAPTIIEADKKER